MHIFGVTVWLGGLLFQGAVALPIFDYENQYAQAAMKKVSQRFTGFVWMSAWTIAITGVIMMLLSPRFVWFQFNDKWSILLACKEVIFVLMVFYAFGYARMLSYLSSPSSNGGFNEKAEMYKERVSQFRKISTLLGIIALGLAAAM